MKPTFALDFRNDAIALLHRTARGWTPVGQVALDAPDLADALGYLRSTSLGLSPRGLTTKLVIPNSQVLYTRVRAPGPEVVRRRKQVARALEGRTPYAVDDLVYDISGEGPDVMVAVIARETLAEAEAFAVEHRFNPVSFVAVPDPDQFTGEAWFGPTSCAAKLLPAGQKVERDIEPLPTPARGAKPAAEAAAPPQATTELAPAPAEQTAQAAPSTDDTAAIAEPDTSIVPDDDAPQRPATPVPTQDAEPDAPAPSAVAADAPEVATSVAAEPAANLHPTVAVPDIAEPGPVASDTTDAGPSDIAITDPHSPPPAALSDDPALPDQPADAAQVEPVDYPPVQPSEIAATLEPEEVLAREFGDLVADAEPVDPVPHEAPPLTEQPNTFWSRDAEPNRAPAQTDDIKPATPPQPAATPDAPMADEAPMALDVVDDQPDDPPAAIGQPLVTANSIADDMPPPIASSVMVAFASRRAAEAAAKEASGKSTAAKSTGGRAAVKSPALGAVTAIRTAPPPRGGASAPAIARPISDVVALPPRPTLSTVQTSTDGAGTAPALTGPSLTAPSLTAKSTGKPGNTGKTLRGLGALVTSPSIPGVKQRRPMVQASPSATAAAVTASATQTAKPAAKPYSGGLGSRSMEQRGKPRYLGLILTGILLVFLALVAAWSTFFVSARNSDPATTGAVVEEADTALSASDPAPAPEDEMLADLQDPADFAGQSETEIAAADAAPDVDAALDVDAAAESVVSNEPEPAPDTAITTETATAPAPASDPQDEIFLAAMDAAPEMPDALSLPPPSAQSDAPPGAAVPPPPFGTVYQFDSAGNILPTPEGILTPEGVLLVAGPPPVIPPQRPAALTAAATDTTATLSDQPTSNAALADLSRIYPTATDSDGTAAAQPDAAAFPADPALADARPRPRPADLAPATAAPATQNADDDASIAPATDSRFASLRPRLRPPALFAAAASAAAAAIPTANLGAQAAALSAQASLVSATGPISPLALTVSRKPAPRPQDMSRAVEAAVAVASRSPEPRPQVPEVQAPRTDAAVADTPRAASPESDNEPEVASAMPRLPTRASVAKQATFVNAINLSKPNLIGVYGSQSNRSALIRQANGRYKKVQVGDSFDGGRVAAITASELRYQKSGKIHTLALPKS